ncbi:hypothetical protein IP91_00197 [Pseudoduganella lurida]|uniref:Integrase catalytic domain-containing protein n=2 Tax=Pseudoduganella lurida TaxID=1036180 RepID=A0A562RJC4_9BURK|nr:hypothetical protein IP91_00197 [Pseudoduganella lurida]
MNMGSRRSLIPSQLCDLTLWPMPDEAALDSGQRSIYQRRKQAVEMYAAAKPYGVIQERVSLSPQEVRRLVKRCVTSDGNGTIAGFTGLIPGYRIKEYKRTAPVVHFIGGSSGGCAGALTLLFEQRPEIRSFVDDEFLKRPGRKVPSAKTTFRDLHGSFITKLRECGLGDDDWPFNTKDCGYRSLRKYCHGLRTQESGRWFGARAGVEAQRRSSVGSGHRPILPVMRGMTSCQLDFHKVDAASIILLETSEGERIPVPVARWHIGLLVEERWGLVLGAWIALELNPSADSVLEVVEASLRPIDSSKDGLFCTLTVDGKVFPNQVKPELAYQGFSVLKMDNAWSNAATEVVDNIIQTVGCAVNFGPVRAWWRRSVVERIFGQLTRRGLQRLPSTLGSGPKDPIRNDPVGQAIKFKITIKDLIDVVYGCIREHNETRSEGVSFASPMSALLNSLDRPASGVFLQPLPKRAQSELKLMMHKQIATVRGSLKKHERPYVNLGRWRYSNPELAASYHLIGRDLILYCDRRDVQIVHATVRDSGEQLGALNASPKWAHLHISWRERAALNNAGLTLRQRENGHSPVKRWRDEKTSVTKAKNVGAKQNIPTPKEGLEIARATFAAQHRGETAAPVSDRRPHQELRRSATWMITGFPESDLEGEVLYGD